MAANKTSFKKGQTKAPTAGRKKGVVNKRTAEANDILERAMLELSGTLEQDVAAVNASRRLQLLTDLFNYAKPKLSATTNENKDSVAHSGEVKVTISFGNGSNPFEGVDNG